MTEKMITVTQHKGTSIQFEKVGPGEEIFFRYIPVLIIVLNYLFRLDRAFYQGGRTEADLHWLIRLSDLSRETTGENFPRQLSAVPIVAAVFFGLVLLCFEN